MQNFKMNKETAAMRLTGGGYATPSIAKRAVGHLELSAKDKAELNEMIDEFFESGAKPTMRWNKSYAKILTNISNKIYKTMPFAQHAINRAVGITKKERAELLRAATEAYEGKKIALPSIKRKASSKTSVDARLEKASRWHLQFALIKKHKSFDDMLHFLREAVDAGQTLPDLVEDLSALSSLSYAER